MLVNCLLAIVPRFCFMGFVSFSYDK